MSRCEVTLLSRHLAKITKVFEAACSEPSRKAAYKKTMGNEMKRTLNRWTSGSGVPYLSLLVTVSALILLPMNDAAKFLQYDRTAIAAGQFWRIITGHWTHWSFEHFLWCGITFVALGAVCERIDRKGFVGSLVLSTVFIPVFCWYAAPAMHFYRGLSGLCSSIFVVAAIQMARKAHAEQNWAGVIMPVFAALLFFAKILFEFINGQALFVHSADMFTPVPLAHLAGCLVGMITVSLTGFRVQREIR